MRFLNVEWLIKTYGIWHFKRAQVLDEIEIRRSTTPGEYDRISTLYRQLRLNYEKGLRYHEAGDFYIGEMEMRRLELSCGSSNPITKWLHRNLLSALAWYRNFSFYGESYGLSLLWIIAAIVVFAFARSGVSGWLSLIYAPNFPHIMSFASSFWSSLNESFFAFFQLRNDHRIDLVERLVGAFLTAMLFIPLKRHLERH